MKGEQLRAGMCVQLHPHQMKAHTGCVWVWWLKSRLLSLILTISSLTSTAEVASAAAIPFQGDVCLGLLYSPEHSMSTEPCCLHSDRKFSMWELHEEVHIHLVMRGECSTLGESTWGWKCWEPQSGTVQEPNIKTQMSSHSSLTVPLRFTLQMCSQFLYSSFQQYCHFLLQTICLSVTLSKKNIEKLKYNQVEHKYLVACSVGRPMLWQQLGKIIMWGKNASWNFLLTPQSATTARVALEEQE